MNIQKDAKQKRDEAVERAKNKISRATDKISSTYDDVKDTAGKKMEEVGGGLRKKPEKEEMLPAMGKKGKFEDFPKTPKMRPFDEYGQGYPMKEAEERLKKIEERNAQRESGSFKKGGSVAPSKKTLAKSGFYDKDKTKSEREKIVGKVTTKPQRVKMVEKMLSTKKMKSGGSVSKRADGVAIKGKTKGRFV